MAAQRQSTTLGRGSDGSGTAPDPIPGSTPDSIQDHGGALARAEARFGRPAAGWLDLSTGINPWPWPWPDPLPPPPPDAWTRLPGAGELDRLRSAAARFFGAPDPAAVIAAPGSQALIQAVPRLLRPGRTAVLGFTYAEHARCWTRAGHRVTVVGTLDEARQGHDCVVVVNPNNPDGRRCDPAALTALACDLAGCGGLLVVDEAFAEVAPELSLAASAGLPGLLVLRSFGKFFGLAGLRLGFALGPPDLVARLDGDFGPWAVSGPALEIGRAALDDGAWIAATRTRLAGAASRLDRLLRATGLDIAGGTDLFRLVAVAKADALYEALGRRGILVRPFAGRPDRLRFGLPPDPQAEARLAAALAEAAAAG